MLAQGGRSTGEAAKKRTITVLPTRLRALVRSIVGELEPPEPEPLPPGTLVGRFELVRELGRGSFGVVHEAVDPELGRSVALKIVRPGRAEAGEAALAREADAVARLSHPNLVTLHDKGQSEHGTYLVFELLHGQTLQQRIEKGPLSVREAVRIAVEVARGLAHAHGQGLVHRDLKPSNVFLTVGGLVKILDFGMAHAFGRRRASGGTPAYMAPEQWLDAPEDERTDVFALGVMLYRALSGEYPFPDDGGRWVHRDGAGPHLEVPGSPEVGELVGRMLERAPTDRPRDGAEVLEALERIDGELRARTPGGTGPVRSVRQQAVRSGRRYAALLGAACLVAAAAGVGWYVWTRGNEGQRAATNPAVTASIAVLPFADLSPNHDQEYFSDGVAEEIMTALAGVQGLHVPGRTSSFSFKGKNEEPSTIAEKLHVTSLLEGSVRKDGTRLRITAKLVNAANGYQVWAETFEREVTGVFAIQDEIARAVVGALAPRLLQGGALDDSRRRPRSTEAYLQYLLARQLRVRAMTVQTVEAWGPARAAIEKVTELEPGFARAWANLATILSGVYDKPWQSREKRAEARKAAFAAVEKAVDLAPDLCDGYFARAMLRERGRDWLAMKSDVERALRLCPTDGRTHVAHASILAALGRTQEAIEPAIRGTELEPLSATMWEQLAQFHLFAGQIPMARKAALRAVEISPDHHYAALRLVELDLLEGNAEGVRRTLEGPVWNQTERRYYRLMTEASRMRRDAFDAGAKKLIEKNKENPEEVESYQVAQLFAWRGDRDRAFAWLERAEVEELADLSYVLPDPFLRSLHDDPRWKPFLRKLNLPAD